MRITLEDGFSDFSGKHSDILRIFLHKNQKKNPLWYSGQPIMALGPVCREWYKHLNKMIGNKKHNLNFTNIPELAYKAINEQIEIVNNHFGSICKKYPPLDKNIKIMETGHEESLNNVSEVNTYKMLKKYSKKILRSQ